jgi:hypothetical protein
MTLVSVLQVIVGLGLLNVWLVRRSNATAYRGGDAQTLREEFAAYGLPDWFFLLVGALKVLSAVGLLVGLWVPSLVLPAASVVVVLMLGALAMHVKVQDPPVKSLPALLMLAMSAAICGLTLSS